MQNYSEQWQSEGVIEAFSSKLLLNALFHELNQSLTAILGTAELAKYRKLDEENLADYSLISEEALKLKQIIARLHQLTAETGR